MDLLATLRRSGGIDAMGKRVGLSPVVTFACAQALMPALLTALNDTVQRLGGGDSGILALLAMFESHGDGNLAADVMGPGTFSPEAGRKLAAEVFAGESKWRGLPDRAAAESGQNVEDVRNVLAVLVMLVCGYISARAEASTSTRDIVGQVRRLLADEAGKE